MNQDKDLDIFLSKRGKVGIYENIFAQGLLDKLKSFYKSHSLKLLSLSVPEYLTSIEESLKFEEEQCSYYYERSTDEVLEVIEKELISTHIEILIKVKILFYIYLQNESSGLTPMLNKRSQSDIKLFYKLSKRRKGNDDKELSIAFSSYIENTGKKINEEVKDPIGINNVLN